MVKQTFLNLPEDKRKKIIEVALEEFASHPYTKASLSSIVSRAGIAKGSMYQYFEDKKALYVYLIDMAALEKMEFIKNQVNLEGDFFTVIEQSIMAGIRFNLQHPQLSRLIANAMEPSADEVLHNLLSQGKRMSVEFFQQLLVRGQRQGTVRSDLEPRLVANMLYSVLGTGLADYVLDSIGVSMHDYLTNPELAEPFSEERIKGLTSQVMKLLRYGIEAAKK